MRAFARTSRGMRTRGLRVDKITTTMVAGIELFTGKLTLGGVVSIPVGLLALAIVGIIMHGLLHQQP